MKKLISVVSIAVLITACANKPVDQNLIIDKDIQGMSRNEVIIAIQECESSGMRAVLIQAKRKINTYTADVVVDVTCAPRFKF